MIVDWKRHCEWMHKEKAVGTKDASERKIIRKQELIFLRYLSEELGFNKEACFQEWKQLKDGNAEKLASSEGEQRTVFDSMFGKQIKRFANVNIKTCLKPVIIYKSALDFLNKLDAPLWMKQYWGALLVYYKFSIQNSSTVYKSSTLNAWCMQHTEYKSHRYGGVCQDEIARKQLEMGIRVIYDIPRTTQWRKVSYYPAFIKKGGKYACRLSSIDEVDRFLEKIHDTMAICTKCGRSFIKNSKTKRTLCERCYRRFRKVYKKENQQNSRKNARKNEDM